MATTTLEVEENLQINQETGINPALNREIQVLHKIAEQVNEVEAMDRVTRNLIFNIPHHTTPQDGSYYSVQPSSREAEEDPYWINKVSKQRNEETENGISPVNSYIAVKVASSCSPDKNILSNSETMSVLDEKKVMSNTAEMTDSFAEKPDVWMQSPDRETKLELLKQEHSYGIWAYTEGKNPSKLFSEPDHEMASKGVKIDSSPEKMRELEEERKDIIKKQIVKKRCTIAERWHSMEDLDSGSTSSPKRLEDGYSPSFALCFDNPSSQKTDTPISSENIDTEQINFAAAREQFIKLEMENQNVQFSPKPQLRNSRVVTLTRNSPERNWPNPYEHSSIAQDSSNTYCHGVADTYNTLTKVASRGDEVYGLPNSTKTMAESGGRASSLKEHCLITTSREDLDSGLDEMPLECSTGYASDGSTSHELFGSTQDLHSTGEQLVLNETPIQREIRLALEREEELRRERGILKSANPDELMEIPKRPLLSLTNPSSPSWKTRDKWRGDIFLQREIEKETKREADLKNEGNVTGTYDKGMVQELGERRKIFEQKDDIPVFPFKTIRPNKTAFEEPEWEGSLNLKEDVKPSYNTAESRNLGSRLEPYQSFSTSATAEPSSYETSVMPSRGSSEYFLASQPLSTREAGGTPASRSEETFFIQKDHFYLGPSMPRFSVIPEQEQPTVSRPTNEQENILQNDYSSLGLGSKSIMNEEKRPSGFGKEKEQGTFIVYKKYFKLQPWRPRLRVKEVDSQDTPLKGNQQENIFFQDENFRLKPLKPHRSSLIEKEIEEALQREEELQEQRRRRDSMLPDSICGHSDFDEPQSQHSSQRSGGSGSYLVSQSPILPHPQLRGMASASSDSLLPSESSFQACMFKPSTYPDDSWGRTAATGPGSPQGTKEDQLHDPEDRAGKHSTEMCYAGIDPSDLVNTKIVESTRVNRHKSVMALRWEAGLYANKDI
ncbi:mitotic interactor and substrate of PLK1 isoform X2 [Microcaecilia unicolor]|uniref:Mitotic interactor and substrate of PLK1 isoform X2 n=1 Tax=Microcaecilia unicolor TaxID=1415580 RepID=A0A6P7ZEQ3_9AMPH|nr:mitotic interactor and substrate of PLK1 isoform X2 [Microcaecilia unicolor]